MVESIDVSLFMNTIRLGSLKNYSDKEPRLGGNCDCLNANSDDDDLDGGGDCFNADSDGGGGDEVSHL